MLEIYVGIAIVNFPL